MTQLDALVILVDAASCQPREGQLATAMKVVEKRIQILQDRRKRRRTGKKTMPL